MSSAGALVAAPRWQAGATAVDPRSDLPSAGGRRLKVDANVIRLRNHHSGVLALHPFYGEDEVSATRLGKQVQPTVTVTIATSSRLGDLLEPAPVEREPILTEYHHLGS